MNFEIKKYPTKDLIRMYKSHLDYLQEIKKELFERLDGKKVGRTVVSWIIL